MGAGRPLNTGSMPDGFVSRHGLGDAERRSAATRVLQSVRDAGVSTVRVSFVDQHGVPRGKVIVAGELESALENGLGITSTLLLKDTAHGTVFPVWKDDAGFGPGVMTGASDLVMVPDPVTYRELPWAPGSGWILADLYEPGGRAIPLSTRSLLGSAISRLADAGMAMVCGLEVEFAVYRVTEENLSHHQAGKPGDPPATELIAQGYQYLTEQTYDRLQPVMDLIRRHAEALGLPLRTLEAEFGPSQFEMTFQPGDPLTTADNMVLFRSMVKQVTAREGLHATFMCRPAVANAMGNGWHLHQSVRDTDSGHNLFVPADDEPLSPIGAKWLAGLLEHAVDGCLLATPTINGYKRYQPYALAPDRVQWGRDNRGAMIRSLCRSGDPASRLENRVGEPAANPYLYIGSQIIAGLDGITRGLSPPAAVEAPYDTAAGRLPDNLADAITAFDNSAFWRDTLGSTFVDYLVRIKRAEWKRFTQWVTDWEQREYFSLF